MASTYSTNLGFELIGTGDQAGTWGTSTNNNLGTLIEEAICGYTTFALTGGTDNITIPNGTTGTARKMALKLTGTGGGTLTVPDSKSKLYFINNASSGSVSFKTVSGTGVTIPQNAKSIFYSDGTNIVDASNYFSALTLGSALTVASGGTGAATLTGILVGNGTSAFTAVAAPAGTIVGTTDAQTLTNKILTAPTINSGALDTNSTVSDGSTGFQIGYRSVPQNAQSGNYTLALADNGKHVYSTVSTSQTVTIPTNASVNFPVGACVTIVNDGSVSLSLAPAGGVTLKWAGTSNTGARTIASIAMVSILQVATNEWFLNGAGIT